MSSTLYDGVRGARAQEPTAAITNKAATVKRNIDGTFGVGILRRCIGVLPNDSQPYLQRAVELAPGQADFHYNLAGALAEIGKSDEAVAAYQRTLVLSPDSADAHNNLGNLLQQRGDVAAAIEHYEAALRLDAPNLQP